MKKIGLGMILLSVLLSSCLSPIPGSNTTLDNISSGQSLISKHYDKFSQQTSLTTDPFGLAKNGADPQKAPVLSITIACKGDVVEKSAITGILFSLVSINKEWKYLEFHDVKCLADDKIVEIPKTEHNGTIKSGGLLLEMVYSSISFDLLQKLWDSAKLEFKVGHTELVATNAEMLMLRELKSYFIK